MRDTSSKRAETKREDLPKAWEVAELRDICLPISSVDPRKQFSRAFSYVDVSTIDRDSGTIGNAAEVKVGDAPSRAKQLLRQGDVLLSGVRIYLRNVALVEARLDGQIGSTAFCVLRPAADIECRFLYWFARSDAFIGKLIPLQRGNSPPAVLDEDIKSQRIPVPPANEQRRIVAKIDELFGDIEEGERCLARAGALLKQYRQSVLKAAVTGELSRDWRAKNKDKGETGADLLRRILKTRREAWEMAKRGKKYVEPAPPDMSNLPELPEGWCWASLDQLSWAASYGTSTKCDYNFPGVGVLRIPNIRQGSLTYDDLKRATNGAEIAPHDLVRPGDLLVIRTNGSESLIGVGAVAQRATPLPVYYASYLIRFRLVDAPPLWQWTNFCWQSASVRNWVGRNAATSAGQYNISLSKLVTVLIPLPPVEEQGVLCDTIDGLFSASITGERQASAERERGRTLRQSILRAAFAGKLVPQDPADEPAAALLQRIAAERAKALPPDRKRRRGRESHI